MRMLKFSKRSLWAFILLALIPAGLAAQNFVYTNNDLAAGNSISAFSVDVNGALGPIAGSPFATGGLGTGGGLYAANRIIVVKNFLYASNSGSNTVSAFTIYSASGALASIGSPIATLGSNDATASGISLAATPQGTFLYAGTTDGQITVFSINSLTGALTTVGSPVVAGGIMSSMKVSPNGKFLAVALYLYNDVAVFAIQSDGTLLAVPNSPFTLKSGNGSGTGIDINCASSQLFVGRSGPDIDVFNIASDGELTELTNSPFSTGTIQSNQVVALSPDDGTLFSSNQGGNTVTAFTVGTDGSLTVPGTTVSAGSGALYPGGLAVNQDGTFLYAADTTVTGGFGGVSSFSLAVSPPLSLDFLTSTSQISGLHSLAAYPAKVCASSPTSSGLVASLQISAGPPPSFDLEATLSLDPSLVVDPLTQAVTIQVGSFSITLPAGSFKAFRNGTNSGIYLYQGVVNSTTLKVQITPLGQNQFQISAYDKQIDLTGLFNPVTVTVGIGGNSASALVTANMSSPLGGNGQGY